MLGFFEAYYTSFFFLTVLNLEKISVNQQPLNSMGC